MIARLLAILLVSALAAYGAGTVLPATLFRSAAERVGLRIAAGLALYATLFFALAAAGRLRLAELLGAAAAGVVAAVVRGKDFRVRPPRRPLAATAVAAAIAGAFVLALYPPTAFDETLYHLPTVAAFAASGRMPFVASLRVPVFPNAAEALEVPLYLFGGDVATHLLALLATIATTFLVFASARRDGETAGWLGAAIFLSSPIVIHLASTGYVEAPLALFCFGAWIALDRGESPGAGRIALAGALAGTAAAVKYLGLPWVAGIGLAAAALSARGTRLRAAAVCAAVSVAVLGPWYLRIFRATGNPVFPFLPGVFGHSAWDPVGLSHAGVAAGLRDLVRVPWDTLFARGRLNAQPPFSPWFLAASPLLAWLAVRDRRARIAAGACIAWGIVWLTMPRDSRYLAILLPVVSVETARAAVAAAGLLRRRIAPAAAALALLPGIAYAGYGIARQGPVPEDASARARYLTARVPGYAAVAFLDRAAPNATVFVCGGEQLRAYYSGTMIGDVSGIARYDEVLSLPDGGALARRLDALGVRYVLRVRKACRAPVLDRVDFPFRTVYSD
ncbi:MAG TPA: hypothetical protein VFS34_11085, partial [Thermoanaerobaculia bacterium]|nr:hypothetical protein [Thermoanaerobaculia bacterium]